MQAWDMSLCMNIPDKNNGRIDQQFQHIVFARLMILDRRLLLETNTRHPQERRACL